MAEREEELEIRILFFAKARELVNVSSAAIRVPNSQITEDQLLTLIELKFPELKVLKRGFVLALNEEYAGGTLNLKSGDEIAIIPPISGG